MTFRWLYLDAGFNDEEHVAKFFEVTPRTVRNWKKTKPPRAVLLCLSMMAGRLDAFPKPWKGFRLTPEALESPEGDFVYPYEVRAIRYVYQAAGIDRARTCNMLNRTTVLKPRDNSLSSNLVEQGCEVFLEAMNSRY